MARTVRFDSLFINTKITRCAHSCRYCSISTKNFSDLPFSRFEALVDGLIDWASRNRDPDFGIYPVANNCDDVERDTIPRYMALRARAGRFDELITTGGLRMRPEVEMRDWLAAWRDVGIRCIHASYAGSGAMHDRWNGRRSDFVWLMGLQRLAGELGMELGQSLFLTKSTLPLLDGLIEQLDTIEAKIRYRWIFPFAYVGLAARHEDDRIDESMRDALPDRLLALAPDAQEWHSEREWIDRVSHHAAETVPQPATLHVEVTDSNIDRLETTSWDDILADLEDRTLAVYDVIPPADALCRIHGDASNRRIYTSRGEMDRLWLARYLAQTGTKLDLTLTQLGVDQ